MMEHVSDNNPIHDYYCTQYVSAKRAVEALAGVCDGALVRDKQGFDGADTRAGHFYAFLPIEAWPLSAFHRAWHWTQKYQRQLAALGVDCSQLAEPSRFEGEDRQIALLPDGSGFYVVFPNDDWELIEALRRLPGSASYKVPIGESGKLFFRYRTYRGDGRVLLAFAEQYHFCLSPGVRERAQPQSPNRVVYDQGSDSFALYFPDRTLNAEVKAIPGYSYSLQGGFHWVIAARRQAAAPLSAFLTRHGFALSIEAEQRLQALQREGAHAEVS